MTFFCPQCKLVSPDGNRWCQQLDCPAGRIPRLFSEGERLSAFTILRMVRVFPGSTVYLVEWEKKQYFLKLSTADNPWRIHLEREAETVRQIAQSRKLSLKQGLPKFVMHPEESATAWGETTLSDVVYVYFLMEYVEGTILYDELLDHPQPWQKHVGWFIQSLARTIDGLHQMTAMAHLNLTPDSILVYRNNRGIPQPLLLDLGFCLPLLNESQSGPTQLLRTDEEERLLFVQPAYANPLILKSGTLEPTSELFSIGLITYEMLAGRPTYPYKQRTAESILEDIRQKYVPRLERRDLPQPGKELSSAKSQSSTIGMIQVLEKMLGRSGESYESIKQCIDDLYRLYGAVPYRPKLQVWLRYAAAGILIAFIGGAMLALSWSLLAALLQ